MGDDLSLDPLEYARTARNPAEYVAALRCLREWTGLSYRQLSARAAANGDHLPYSTLASALTRNSLPHEEMIAAFVRSCASDQAEQWIVARRHVAASAEAPRAGRDAPRSDRRRERLLALVVAVVAGLVGAYAAVLRVRHRGRTAPGAGAQDPPRINDG
jgi:lambda repressor-like predicted transcriptional regulator